MPMVQAHNLAWLGCRGLAEPVEESLTGQGRRADYRSDVAIIILDIDAEALLLFPSFIQRRSLDLSG